MDNMVPFESLYAVPSRNGLTKPKAVRGFGIKIVNMGELFAYPRMLNIPADKAPLTPKEQNAFFLKSGDLLFARQSLVLAGAGKCSIFLADKEAVTFESHIIRVRLDPDKADPNFYYYYFRSPAGRALMESIVEQGAGVAGIRASDLSRLEVDYLPVTDQNTIADILGSLDDKIELNQRMNETLEEMARALFKSWFVDFDPVVAKSEGRLPDGMDAETAKLFPSSFEDSEIGRIPNGWRVLPFAETVNILSGGTPKTTVADFWDGGIPWFSVVDSPSDSDVFVMETEKTITQVGIENSATQVLPLGTTIISARGTVGKACIVGVPMAMNQSCFGLRDRSGNKGYFTYYSIKSLVSTLQNHAHGSVFATINRNTFNGVNTIVPPQAIVHVFEEAVDPLLSRIRSNLLERRTLATTRDALLPRLLSGDLRVQVKGGAL